MANPFGARRVQQAKTDALEYEQPELLDKLASHVRKSFIWADQHRRSMNVERDMLRCLRAVSSVYDPEDMDLLHGDDVYMGITNLKIRGAKSWITDILANSEDQPWTLTASPRPDLPDAAKAIVQQQLMQEIQQYGLDPQSAKDRALYLLGAAQRYTDQLAANAADRMEGTLKERLLDGDWRNTFEEFTSDLMTYPTAVLKGPVACREEKLTWEGGTLARVSRVVYRMERVDPLRVYPSPNSTTPDDGAYIIERVDMSPDELAKCMDLPLFQQEAIRNIFARYPNGHREMVPPDRVEELYLKTKTDTHDHTDHQYQSLVYYGKVQGSLLTEQGIPGLDPQRVYESEIWSCGNIVYRAILNPHPLGKRPFYAASFESVPGSFWGRALPQLLRDIQRVANAAARSLVRNMAFSAGPIGEYDAARLTSEEDISEITPYRLYSVEADKFSTTPSPAFRFQVIPSVADQLLKIYEYYSKMADDVSGIPAYVLGNPQLGGAGRTLGGLSMLMGNAAKGIKNIISTVDKHIIEPVVRAYYVMEMLFGADVTAKGDADVVARGAAGLLQRELSQSRAVEVLNMLTPYVSSGLVPAAGLQIVLRDVLRGLGYSADEIVPDPARAQQVASAVGQPLPQQQQPGAAPPSPNTPVPSLSPGTPPPALDGRSTPAPNPGAMQFPAPLTAPPSAPNQGGQ